MIDEIAAQFEKILYLNKELAIRIDCLAREIKRAEEFEEKKRLLEKERYKAYQLTVEELEMVRLGQLEKVQSV